MRVVDLKLIEVAIRVVVVFSFLCSFLNLMKTITSSDRYFRDIRATH